MPVGLLGEQRNTMSGTCSRTSRGGLLGLEPEAGSRVAGSQRVPVASVISRCIEYVGSKPSATRPGPPKACNSC